MMMFKITQSVCIIGAMLALTITPCYASDTFTSFTQYAKQTQEDWQVPGMAIAIVEQGKIVYAKGFGMRNVKGDPVTPNTIFDVASLTKSFTATLLALQIDSGKYTWDTQVKMLDSAFKLYSPYTTQAFEVKDLIAHDSGLPEDALDSQSDFGYSADTSMYAVRFIKPVAPFRQQFAYQDIFLEFAKTIIEKTSNKSYVDNLHEYLFTPLQMNDSYLRTEVDVLNQKTNRAQPFLYYQGKNYPYAKDSPYLSKMWALTPGVAGGGIQSSAVDMAKWLIFNMSSGKINNKQWVSEKNFSFIHSPQTIIKSSTNGQIEQAYGEGWFIDKQSYQPYTVLYHMGGGTGMHALMAYMPEKDVGIVILTNQYTNQVPEILYRKFFDMYLNKKSSDDWNQVYLKQRKQQEDKVQLSSNATYCQHNTPIQLTRYVGSYINPIYGSITITLTNNHLSLSIGPQKITWQLSVCKPNVLKAYWPNPNGMDVPMLQDNGQNLMLFKENQHHIETMLIPYLNDDGGGRFIKHETH